MLSMPKWRIKRALAINQIEEADQYIEKAKASISDHKFNTEWINYTKKISKANPFKAFFVLFSLLPALLQVIQFFNLNYTIADCYEDDNINNYLDRSKCITYNGNNFSLSKEFLSERQVLKIHLFIFNFFITYLALYMACYFFFARNKYLVKMLGIGVKITQMFAKLDLVLAFSFLSYLFTLGTLRSRIQTFEITTSHTNSDGSASNITFIASISSGSTLMAVLQFLIIFLCFVTLVFKFYKDPLSSFVTLKDFIDNAQSTGFDLNSMKYTVNDGSASTVIQALFRLYKKKEDETVILVAALEFFKAKEMIIESDGEAISDPLLMKNV